MSVLYEGTCPIANRGHQSFFRATVREEEGAPMIGREQRTTECCSERVHSEAGSLHIKVVLGIEYRVTEEIEDFAVVVFRS